MTMSSNHSQTFQTSSLTRSTCTNIHNQDLHLGPLYTRLGVGPSTNPIHMQLSPQSGPTLSTFVGPTFSHAKWWGPTLRPDVLVGKVQWRELTFHGLTIEMFIIQRMSPIWPMLRVQVEKKLVPISSSQLDGLMSKLCHLGHHVEWVSVQVAPLL